MTALTISTDLGSDPDLFGKDVDDLQSGIVVGENGISGTLKYVADYSSAYGPGMDSGHYIALHAEVPDVEDVTIKIEVLGGTVGEQTIDPSDGNVICYIKDTTKRLKFTATKTGAEPVVKIFRLNGLILA